MTRKLKLSAKALQDIQEAIDYYNSKHKGLGKKFANTIDETFGRIIEMPQAASIAYSDVRYKITDHFPFIITYDFDDHSINVFRIFNTNLNPEKL